MLVDIIDMVRVEVLAHELVDVLENALDDVLDDGETVEQVLDDTVDIVLIGEVLRNVEHAHAVDYVEFVERASIDIVDIDHLDAIEVEVLCC